MCLPDGEYLEWGTSFHKKCMKSRNSICHSRPVGKWRICQGRLLTSKVLKEKTNWNKGDCYSCEEKGKGGGGGGLKH